MEPRTVLNPLSVVLVDEDGAWVRFELQDDAFIRELAKKEDGRRTGGAFGRRAGT